MVCFHRLQTPIPAPSGWHLSRASYTIAYPPTQARRVSVVSEVGSAVTVGLVELVLHGTGRQPHGSARISAIVETSLSGHRRNLLGTRDITLEANVTGKVR